MSGPGTDCECHGVVRALQCSAFASFIFFLYPQKRESVSVGVCLYESERLCVCVLVK